MLRIRAGIKTKTLFALCILTHLILSNPVLNLIESSGLSNRRIKENFALLTADEIEAAAGNWKHYPSTLGVDVTTITHLRGKKLKTDLIVARKPTDPEVFFKHIIAKILNEYFLKIGKYTYNHVPDFLTTYGRGYEGGYYYIFVKGNEGFPWEIIGSNGERIPVTLEEWDSFKSVFYNAGITMSDVVENTGNSGKNIVLEVDWQIGELYKQLEEGKIPSLPKYWQRIDYDTQSMPVKRGELEEFLKANQSQLYSVLGKEKFDFLNLAFRGYKFFGELKAEELVKFNKFLSDYQSQILKSYFP